MAGDFVTADVAHAAKCNNDKAEKIKIMTGCGSDDAQPVEGRLESLVAQDDQPGPDPKVMLAIAARYSELFLTIRDDIRRAKAEHFIKLGVVLTGGGSCCFGIERLAARIFGVSAKRDLCMGAGCFDASLRHPRFSTVTGLLLHTLDPFTRSDLLPNEAPSFIRRAWNAITCRDFVLT